MTSDPGLGFLAGGGAMGERIRAYPWAQTPLREPQFWPQGLRTAARVLLTTQHPMFIFWGHEHTCLYNDAYSRSLGSEKHPSILGAPGRASWEEIWPIIGPQIEQVMRGEGATWHENQLVPIIRHGALQDVYWTYSFGPIDEPEFLDGVGGVLVICTETTEQVLAERRLSAERERFVQLFDQAPTFLAVLRGPGHVIELANPDYLRLVGHRAVVGRRLADALPDAVEQGYLTILDEVYRTGKPFSAHGAKYAVQVSSQGPVDERYVDFVYQPIADRDGSVTGILVQGVDVTARALADRALALDRARLDYATRLSGIGFWYCDLPFAELEWDERVKEHFFSRRPPGSRSTISIKGFMKRTVPRLGTRLTHRSAIELRMTSFTAPCIPLRERLNGYARSAEPIMRATARRRISTESRLMSPHRSSISNVYRPSTNNSASRIDARTNFLRRFLMSCETLWHRFARPPKSLRRRSCYLLNCSGHNRSLSGR